MSPTTRFENEKKEIRKWRLSCTWKITEGQPQMIMMPVSGPMGGQPQVMQVLASGTMPTAQVSQGFEMAESAGHGKYMTLNNDQV